MRPIFAGILCAFCLAQLAAAETPRPLQVFLLAGQSNMVGKGRGDQLPAELRRGPDNVRILWRQGLEALVPRGRVGPEVGFADVIGPAMPNEQVVLVKHAVGGTSALAWSPEWSAAQARRTGNHNNGPLYKELLALVRNLEQDHQIEVVGVIWSQGGRDARFEGPAAEYEENLKKIIAASRQDLGKPHLPWVIARSPKLPAQFPHADQVRAAQERVAKRDPHTKIILTDDFSQGSDKTHFDTPGQIEHGRRFAKAMLELLAEQRDNPPARSK